MTTNRKMPLPKTAKKRADITDQAALNALGEGAPRLAEEARKYSPSETPAKTATAERNEQTTLFPTPKPRAIGVPAKRGRPVGQSAPQSNVDKARAAIYISEQLQLEIAEHLITLRKAGDKQTQRSFIEQAAQFYINHLREEGRLPRQ